MKPNRDVTCLRSQIKLRPVPERHVETRLNEMAQRCPDKLALICPHERSELTYAGLSDLAARFGAQLEALGAEPGDRIGIMLPNGSDWVACWFASLTRGFVDVGIDCEASGTLLQHYLTSAGVRVVVCSASSLEAVVGIAPTCPELESIIVLGGMDRPASQVPVIVAVKSLRALPPSFQPVRERDPRDAASIRFTSGSTGPAKAAVLSGSQLEVWADHMVHLMRFTEDDRLYTPFPMNHHLASVMGVLASIYAGGTCILDRRFSRRAYWENARQENATLAHLMYPLIPMLLSSPPSEDDRAHSVRKVYIAHRDAAFEERFGVQIQAAYALTEGSVLAYLEDDDPGPLTDASQKVGGLVLGRSNPLFEVEILDENDERCSVGSPGIISYRPRCPFTVMQSYFRDPQATLDAMTNGWYHTGDIGALDDEGYLHFFERSGDTIRRRGKNIPAFHIEEAAQSFAGVEEVAVVAVPSPLGESEAKLCVTRAGGSTWEPVDLVQHLMDRLPSEYVPRFLEVVANFPRTRTEKIAKNELRRQGPNGDGFTASTVSVESLISQLATHR